MSFERPVAVSINKLGEHRGSQRLWLEGMKLVRAGIGPGDRFSLEWDAESGRITLAFKEDGDRVVSKRTRHNREMPIIDIGGDAVETALGEGLERAQVTIFKGRIVVDVHPDDKAARERIERLVERVRNGEQLETGSLAHGGGIIDHAIHSGMHDAGLSTRLAFAVEYDDEIADVAPMNNPIWDDRTIQVHGGMQYVDPSLLPKVDVLVAGLPCTGASKAGKAKNKNRLTETHETAGGLVVPFLQIVKATSPAVVILENVVPYGTSASAELIRASLTTWGYDVSEVTLDGNEFGALEQRKRLCLIGHSKELSIALDRLLPTRTKEKSLAEILETLSPDDPRWRSYAHHLKKAASDAAAGKNFKFNLIDPKAGFVGAMGAGYAKDRQTEPHIKHPTEEKARLLTPVEHARAKTVPPELVAGVSATLAHKILGNSVIWSAWHAVGKHMGAVMNATAGVEVVDTTFEEIVEGPALAMFRISDEAHEWEQGDLFEAPAPR